MKIFENKILDRSCLNFCFRFERRDQAAAAINALNNFVPQGADEPIRIRLAEDHGKQKAAYLAGFRAGMGLPSAPPGGKNYYKNL